MAFDLARIKTIIVDSVALLQSVIEEVMTLRTDTPSLFIDLEGCQLGRHGSISILTIYAPPNENVYLIDINRLGADAFCTVMDLVPTMLDMAGVKHPGTEYKGRPIAR